MTFTDDDLREWKLLDNTLKTKALIARLEAAEAMGNAESIAEFIVAKEAWRKEAGK